MSWISRVATAIAAVGFAASLWLWAAGDVTIDLGWAPTLDLRLAFDFDGLAVLYALLATGIGAAVFAYSGSYLPRGPHELRFYGFLVLFMGSMVGLAAAQDLVALFVFWDLTAVSSYFLIGYDRDRAEARSAALLALVVTGVTAVLLLIGTLILYVEYGTFALPELFERARPGTTVTLAAALMTVAGLAKSAQVPFHFWLPRAMAAPTPVSAYLHSAAMVAAGVLLIGRLYPLIETSRLLLDALLAIGLASIAIGGVLALTQDKLKQLLAYSTVSQYGYVVTLYGLRGAGAAAFYVLAHALAKSALFMTAGAITEATGEDRLSQLGGLARRLPVLAVGSALAAAGLAALPLTLGFFKDELLFASALERGWPFALAALVAAALTFAYIGRFWVGAFLGPARGAAAALGPGLVVPILALGLITLVGGFVVEPFAALARAAGEVSLGAPVAVEPAYHLDASTENLLALGAYLGGALLLATSRGWRPAALAVARFGERFGPERVYTVSLRGLNRFSDAIHDIEVRDLRTRIAAVVVPGGALVVAGLIATPLSGTYVFGGLSGDDVALALVLGLTALAALATTLPRTHLTILLTTATAGFSLAVVYALLGAPDVALVAVLIETILALVFLAAFSLLPRSALRRLAALRTPRHRRWRDPIVAGVAGLAAFFVVWGALSRPSVGPSVASEQARLTPEAHAADVVTAILADFRGLDTMGEITVVAIAFVGIATLLRRGRLR